MTKHTDKFGRDWEFTPAHDTNRMVKVPTDVMEAFIVADRIIEWRAKADSWVNYFKGAKVECYVLVSQAGVFTGARFGDNGPDYYSSLINDQYILLKLVQYVHRYADIYNLAAIAELFPNLADGSLI